MDWLNRKTDPEASLIFNVSSLPNPARDASGTLRFLRPTERVHPGGNKYGLASPCGCRVYFLVAISHPTTATCRYAYCFFLNVGN
jgi:hypothetical protein